MINLTFKHKHHSDEKIAESIENILTKTSLLSMATVTPDGNAWINNAFYSFNDKLQLFIMTYPDSIHGKNVLENDSVAITIFDSHQGEHDKKQGIQLGGTCEIAKGTDLKEGIKNYSDRHKWLKEYITTPEDFHSTELISRMFVIKVNYIKIFDEVNFGEERWVEVNLPPARVQ